MHYLLSSVCLFSFSEKFQMHVPTVKVCIYPKLFSTKKECIWANVYWNLLSLKPLTLYLKNLELCHWHSCLFQSVLFSWFGAFCDENKETTTYIKSFITGLHPDFANKDRVATLIFKLTLSRVIILIWLIYSHLTMISSNQGGNSKYTCKSYYFMRD